jgi:hypothetical protein
MGEDVGGPIITGAGVYPRTERLPPESAEGVAVLTVLRHRAQRRDGSVYPLAPADNGSGTPFLSTEGRDPAANIFGLRCTTVSVKDRSQVV